MIHASLRVVRGSWVGTAVLVALLAVPSSAQNTPADTLAIVKDEITPGNSEIAVLLSEATPLPDVDTVVIGRDDEFADALASGVLQGRSPLLLVPSAGPIPERVVAELTRQAPDRVVLLGGEAALRPAVAEELSSMGFAVERRAGGSRFETAIAIASTDAPAADTAILARAFASPTATDPTQGFADALAAGAMSAEMGWPVLLTETDRLTPSTAEYLAAAGITRVEIMGGTAAISAEVEATLIDMGITTERLAGPSRAETALAVADKLGAPTAAEADYVVLVDGQAANAWAGGFAAASHAALLDAPIVLATGDSLPPATAEWLSDGAEAPTYSLVPGDGRPVLTCVVVPSVCEQARVALGLPPAAVQGQLELLSTTPDGVAAGGFAPAVSDDGAVVAFLSDGDLDGLSGGDGLFHAYARTPDGTTMVDVTPAGDPATGQVNDLHLSGNGRFVAFTSEDQTLAGGDVGQLRSAYVRDLVAGATRHVSVDVRGNAGGFVSGVSLDEDGSVVTYVSQGDVGQQTGCACYWIWWHDLATDEVGFVHTADGAPVEAEGSIRPIVSGDGRVIAFMTSESLVGEDANAATDAYVFDRGTDRLELVSVIPDGSASGASDFNTPDEIGISHDGRYVAFAHQGTDLVDPPAAEQDQVYLRDRSSGTTAWLSQGGSGEGNRLSANPQISANGRWVVFASFRTLVGDDGGCGVYRWSAATGSVTRMDANPVAESNNCPFRVDVADDGAVVLDHLATLHEGDDSHRNAYGGFDVYRSGPG